MSAVETSQVGRISLMLDIADSPVAVLVVFLMFIACDRIEI